MPLTSALACISAAFACSAGQAPEPRFATSAAITPEDLRQRLFLIADDSMMGRESGSAGDYKTTEYVAAEFQRLGRRATLQLPSGDVLSYAYHPELGALATITDPRGNRYRYTYDLAGQIDSAVVGTSGMDGLLEARRYDAEGRLFAHVRSSPALGTIYTDSLTLDALGRTIRAAYGTRANLSPADTTYLRRGEIAREISPSAHEERGQASGEISRVACGGMLALAYFVAWSTDHH